MSITESIVVEFWIDTFKPKLPPTRVKGRKHNAPHPFDDGCLLYLACTTEMAVPPARNNVDISKANIYSLAKQLVVNNMIPGLPPAGWIPTPRPSDPTDIDMTVDINDDETTATVVLKVQSINSKSTAPRPPPQPRTPPSGAWRSTPRASAAVHLPAATLAGTQAPRSTRYPPTPSEGPLSLPLQQQSRLPPNGLASRSRAQWDAQHAHAGHNHAFLRRALYMC